MTGYSNPFLTASGDGNTLAQQLQQSSKLHAALSSHSQFEFSPLKRAEGRVDQSIETFDFDIFQDIQSGEKENFRVFQRFCLLLLIIHGELERVQQDKTDEFLKQLNVYSEVVNIKQTIADCRF